MKSRVLYLDVLRLFATIAVVFLFNSSFSVENCIRTIICGTFPCLLGSIL